MVPLMDSYTAGIEGMRRGQSRGGGQHRTQAAMPPARKGMESTVYRSEATVMEATERSGCGSSAASRMVTPALHASSTCRP